METRSRDISRKNRWEQDINGIESSLHPHQRQTTWQYRSRRSSRWQSYTHRRNAHRNTYDLWEGDSIQRNKWEGGECAVSFRHGAFVKGWSWRERETGLASKEQLEGENGSKNVRTRRHGLLVLESGWWKILCEVQRSHVCGVWLICFPGKHAST